MASLTDFTKKALGGINQKVSGVQNAASAQQQLAAARAALMGSVSGGQLASAQGVAGKTGSELTNVERYDFWQNSTQEQKDEFVKTGKIPASYTPKTNYTFWNAGNSTIGDYGIDDSNSATWQKIAALYNSGDVDGAMELVNGLSGQGKFGGYYDDNGNYWGFAQGYKGGANASYQPVIGGKIMTTGLDTTGTTIWLTPDGKALSMGQGGVLTDNGDTWSRTSGGDIFRAHAQQLDDAEASRAAYAAQNGGRYPWAQDPVSNGNGGLTYTGNSGGTPYQAALAQADASPGYPSGASGTYTPSQPMSYEQWSTQNGGKALSAPSAYDPNSDTLWQQYLKQYGDAKAPEWAGGDFDYTQNAAYQQYLKDWANKQAPEYAGDPYQAQRDAALAAYGEKWAGSDYQKQRDAALQKAQNMEWNYNPDTDPVWQAYQKQYRREGQRATEDTLGRVAGMTGGMPSSYAVTAASQAGNYYASQLSDKLPELYQQAYQRYLQEYQRQLGISDAYAGFDDREYSRWLQGQQQNLDLANAYNQYGQLDYQKYLDQLGQFNTDRNFNYGAAMDAINQGRSDYNTRYQQYLDQLGQFNTDRNFAYGTARDNQQLGRQANQDEYQRYLDALSQANYEDETAYSRYRDTISDQRYDQEWAQQLREYADQQNWKATEWQQYLREYGDKLSQQEREWVYQQSRDAVSDSRYTDELNYDRARQQYMDKYNIDQDTYNRQLNEAKLAAQYGYYDKLAEMLGIPVSMVQQSYSASGYRTGSGNGGGGGGGGDTKKSTGTSDLYKINAYQQAIGDYDAAVSSMANSGVSADDILAARQVAIDDTNRANDRPDAGFQTPDDVRKWLKQYGIESRGDWQIPNEAAYNRGKEDGKYSNYATYQDFLNAYAQYLKETYGGGSR